MPTKNFRHVRKASVVKTPDGGRLKLGSYRPDKKNPNDKVFQSSQFSTANLPPKVDLRPYMTPVENQGDSNSCTANAMAGAYEYLGKRLNHQDSHVSRLFIYYNARDLDGDPNKDEGTYLRSCIKVLKKYGTCSEQTWPFDLHRISTSPEETAYSEAASFLVEDAYRVDVNLDKMRSCLAEGYPFTFGLELFASFQNAGPHGLIPMPDPHKDQHDGGHAMLCVGYSDPDKVFIVRNSWGDDWGDRGYCYIPYDYMTNPDLNGDLWSIRRVTDSHVDLSQNVHGTATSLFDPATAAIATAIQVPGASHTVSGYNNGYAVEYESQSVYVEGHGYVSSEDYDDLESLYYQEYEDEYEEYTVTEFEDSEESDEEAEASDEELEEESTSEEFEETEDSYDEDSDEEEDDESDEDDDETEETEDSYDEDDESDEDDEDDTDDGSEAIEDSYADEDDADEDEDAEDSDDEADEDEDDGEESDD